jgi:hypothetical protein
MTDNLETLSVAELKRRGIPPKQILAEMKRRGMSGQEMIEAWSPRPPISSLVGSRRFRRRVVMVMYGAWILGLTSAEVSFQLRPTWVKSSLEVIGIFLLVISTLAVLWLNRRTYINAPQLADAELDERLVQIKNQAYRTAYQILRALVLIGWPVSVVVIAHEPGGIGFAGAFVILGGVGLLATTLPTAIVAWGEPDPTEPEKLSA